MINPSHQSVLSFLFAPIAGLNVRKIFANLLLLMACLIYSHTDTQAQITFGNPSFEGAPQPDVTPAPWGICGGTPDTQPGSYGVTYAPFHGNTYIGFQNAFGTGEGATQLLSSQMLAGQSYSFSLRVNGGGYLATPTAGQLCIYGGNASCAEAELLFQTPIGSVVANQWSLYNITLSPTSNYRYITFNCCGTGSVHIDSLSFITAVAPPPKAGYTNTTVCLGNPTVFTDTSKAAPATSIIGWLWNFGDATPTSNLQNPTHTYASAGTFNVKLVVTASDGRKDSTTKVVTVRPLPIVTLSPTRTICSGDTTQLTASGGATYLWAPSATLSSNTIANPRAFPVATTNYTVRVTNTVTGCFKDTSLLITVNLSPIAAISGLASICSGEAVTLAASGGNTYKWLPSGITTVNITDSPVKDSSYKVVAYSAALCTDTAIHTVVVNSMPLVSHSGNVSFCAGGSAILTATGASTYSWSPNSFLSSSNTATVTTSSPSTITYTITGTSAAGCKDDTSLVVTVNPSITNIAATLINESCSKNNGSISIGTVSGGSPAYQYSLNGGANQSSGIFGGLNFGAYSVTVSDSKSCTFTGNYNLTDSPGPANVSLSTTASGCAAPTGSITVQTVNGGSPAYQYALNGGAFQSANTFSSLSAGSYLITIKDATGCTLDTNATITSSNGPTDFAQTVNPENCSASDGNITFTGVTGGSPPYQYAKNIDPFGAPSSFAGLVAGNYTIKVRDAANCIFSKNIVVPGSVAITGFSASIASEKCDLNNGSILVGNIIGGTNPYQFSRSALPYSPDSNITGLDSGSYNITVKDMDGCLLTLPFAVPFVKGIDSLQLTITPATCGLANGQLSFTVHGGTPAYLNNIDAGPDGTQLTYTNLAAGPHNLTVSDNNNCIFQKSFTMTGSTGPTGFTTSMQSPGCGMSNGQITVIAVNGGTPPYQYAYDSVGTAFSSNNVISNLSSGNHPIEVIDNNGCKFSMLVPLNNPAGPTAVNTSISPDNCSNNSGAVSITSVSGGQAPYQYNFNNGGFGSTSTFTNLTGGNYSLVVVDNNNCGYSTNLNVPSNLGPSDFTTAITPTSCGRSLGAINFSGVSGGSAPYSYSFNGQAFTSVTNYNNLPGGIYPLVVRDNNQCLISRNDTVYDIPGPSGAVTQVGNDTCGRNTGSIKVLSGTGVAWPLSYSINGGPADLDSTFSPLPVGVHQLTVTDANGCFYQRVDTIRAISGPSSASIQLTMPHCGQNDGDMSFDPTSVIGGRAPYIFTVGAASNPSGNTFSGLADGSYTFVVSDQNNCSTPQGFTLTDIPGPQSAQTQLTRSTCSLNNGSITVFGVTGGSPPYDYSIDSVNYFAGPQFNNMYSGSYSVFVQDSAGCVYALTAVVPGAPGPSDVFAQLRPENCNRGDGELKPLNTLGGTQPMTYELNGVTDTNFTGLADNTYSLIVRDSNNCLFSKPFSILNKPGPVASFYASSYEGEAPFSVDFKNASSGADSYTWSFGDGDSSDWVNPIHEFAEPGQYNVLLIASDTANCIDSSSAIITVKPAVLLFIPTAFTPDGDGYNDVFRINTFNIASYSLTIFNRWGENIYTITEGSPGWNGTYNNEPCSLGIYSYRIDAVDVEGKKITQFGKISVLR